MALSKPDKKTILKELEEKGKHKGNLTAKEIFEAISAADNAAIFCYDNNIHIIM